MNHCIVDGIVFHSRGVVLTEFSSYNALHNEQMKNDREYSHNPHDETPIVVVVSPYLLLTTPIHFYPIDNRTISVRARVEEAASITRVPTRRRWK